MLEVNFNPFPELQTARFLLRKLRTGDIQDVYEMRCDPDTMRYMARPITKTREDARVHIEKLLKTVNENNGIDWGVEEKASGKVIGTVGIWRIEKDNHRGELGYILNKKWQNKGIMSEVLPIVIRFGFENIQLHSLCANIDPLNVPSARLLEKHKFRREAFFRENILFNGVFNDVVIYSLVKTIDYP